MTMEEGRVENEDYTQDGTVDIKGKPILRSKSGGWKACSFVVDPNGSWKCTEAGLVLLQLVVSMIVVVGWLVGS